MKIFIAHSHSESRELALGLDRALNEAGHEVFEPSVSLQYGEEAGAITAAIRRADLVIALLGTHNPNVYYELGLAAGAHVPTLVASRTPENAAFDLASVPYVQLSGEDSVDAIEIARRVGAIDDAPNGPAAELESDSAEQTLTRAAADPAVLGSITPAEFESLVAELLSERGFPVQTPQGPSDGGYDLLLEGDPVTVVEVKRYSPRNLVSVGSVRQLFGAMVAAGAGRAILISSSQFTASARAAADQWPVELVTLEDLLRLPGPDTLTGGDH
jgi:hypothetical protein